MATDANVLHHDVLLSQYVQHWTPPQDVKWYIADEMFPIVPVDKATNAFKVINQGTFMQTTNAIVGPRGDVGTVQAYYDPEGNYVTRPYALDGIIDHLERDEADDVALYEQLATDLPMTTIRNNLERDAFAAIFNTASLGGNFETMPGDQMFDNPGSLTGNPLLYVRMKCERVMNVTGRKVNFLAWDRLTWRAFKYHPAVQQIAPVHTTPAGLQEITVKMVEDKLQDVMEPGSIRICHYRYSISRGPVTQAALPGTLRSRVGANMIIGRIDPVSRQDISATKQFAFVGDKDLVNGASLLQQGAFGEDVPVTPGVSGAPIAAFTFPLYTVGQRGATGVRVLTNRTFQVTRASSLFVSFGVVNKTSQALYGKELQ